MTGTKPVREFNSQSEHDSLGQEVTTHPDSMTIATLLEPRGSNWNRPRGDDWIANTRALAKLQELTQLMCREATGLLPCSWNPSMLHHIIGEIPAEDTDFE